jgi:hypothetical protein
MLWSVRQGEFFASQEFFQEGIVCLGDRFHQFFPQGISLGKQIRGYFTLFGGVPV